VENKEISKLSLPGSTVVFTLTLDKWFFLLGIMIDDLDVRHAVSLVSQSPEFLSVQSRIFTQLQQALKTKFSPLSRSVVNPTIATLNFPNPSMAVDPTSHFIRSSRQPSSRIPASLSRSVSIVSDLDDSFSSVSLDPSPPYETLLPLSHQLVSSCLATRRKAFAQLREFTAGDLLSSQHWDVIASNLCALLDDQDESLSRNCLLLHLELFRASVPSVQTGEIYVIF
jgi:hypothetical protein